MFPNKDTGESLDNDIRKTKKIKVFRDMFPNKQRHMGVARHRHKENEEKQWCSGTSPRQKKHMGVVPTPTQRRQSKSLVCPGHVPKERHMGVAVTKKTKKISGVPYAMHRIPSPPSTDVATKARQLSAPPRSQPRCREGAPPVRRCREGALTAKTRPTRLRP